MMAENRFNALTLWNLHPFTYMIRPRNFPAACPSTDAELEQWRVFWRTLFRMAKDRGIETYLVNWNIVVSPEFAKAYGVKEKNDQSEIVRRYTRECVTQVGGEHCRYAPARPSASCAHFPSLRERPSRPGAL